METSENLRIKNLSPQILSSNRLLLGLAPKLETSENLRIKNLSPQILSFNRLLLGLAPKLETSENLQSKNLSSYEGSLPSWRPQKTSELRI